MTTSLGAHRGPMQICVLVAATVVACGSPSEPPGAATAPPPEPPPAAAEPAETLAPDETSPSLPAGGNAESPIVDLARLIDVPVVEVPTNDMVVIDGVEIGPGHVVLAGLSDEPGRPAMWTTDDVGFDADIWGHVVTSYPGTGLWPVLLVDDLFDGRPWASNEVVGPTGGASVSSDLAGEILERWAADWGAGPVGPLAAGTPSIADVVAPTPMATGMPTDMVRLGLVPVERPADVVANIGWLGPVNYIQDVAEMSSVLRSWEERYGAYVTGLGFATIHLSVARPPATQDEAIALAREHMAWCPTIGEFDQTAESYAGFLLESSEWMCWWD